VLFRSGEAYNVAMGERTTLNGLLGALGKLMGRDAGARYEAPRPGDVPHSQASIELAGRELGYRPLVSVEEGLSRTIEFFSERAGYPAARAG